MDAISNKKLFPSNKNYLDIEALDLAASVMSELTTMSNEENMSLLSAIMMLH